MGPGPRKKKAPISKGGTMDQSTRPMLTAGGASGFAMTAHSSKIRLGPSTSMAKQLMNSIKAKETSLVARWQGLSGGGETGSVYGDGQVIGTQKGFFPIGRKWGEATNSLYMNMPVYAFNLTSSAAIQGWSVATNTKCTVPMYRLRKTVTGSGAADAVIRNYTWYQIDGQASDGIGSFGPWNIERARGNASTLSEMKTNDRYVHNWSDIGLTLCNSSLTSPHRVHIAVVSFRSEGLGPLRTYYDGAAYVTGDINNADPDIQSKDDLFWDKFLATGSVHPLRTVQAMYPSRGLKIHSYECVCLDTPNAQGKGALLTKRIFATNNKEYNCKKINNEEKEHNPKLNTTLYPSWNTDYTIASSGGNNPFPQRKQDQWLMIWTEDFNAPSIYTDPRTDHVNFDIIVRAKYTYASL